MSDFHFIEPLWLLAPIPLGLLLWWIWRCDVGASAWRRIVDARLLSVLQVGGGGPTRQWPLLLLALGWLLAVIALANPTFEREPMPAFRSDAARVVVLNLSRSMLAEDLTPSRLARARYKVADILARSADGQIGLVAFAGDAFAVSPLTDDAETIRAMLKALSPQIMPVQGSRPDRGLDLGLDLLRQAGARNGEVILLTDDAGGVRATEAAKRLREAGHVLGVIGVGTAEGAPVPGMTSADGPVIARLDSAALEQLAKAGAGRYASLSSSDRDLDRVLIDPRTRARALAERDPMLAERWRELGPWIAVLLVPLAALALRRGWLVVLWLTLAPGALMLPAPALAFGWADLWQRPEQRAAQAFTAGELERARALATNSALAGSAAYRLGDYAEAAARFGTDDSATAHYNRGNALARGGELEAALAAYDEALARDSEFADARHNRAQVEAALRAQAQQPPQQEDQDGESQAAEAEQQQMDDAEGDTSADEHGERQDRQPASDERPAGQSSADRQQDDTDSADASSAVDRGSAETSAKSASASPANSATDAERGEQAATDYRDQAAQASADDGAERFDDQHDGSMRDEPMNDLDTRTAADVASTALEPQEREARQAADQWLRRIPDDPAELLRRKFLYQYQLRQQSADRPAGETPW